MAEKFQRLKFDREIDAIEWTKDPEAYTFKPVILGDKRSGTKNNLKSNLSQPRPVTAPIENRLASKAEESKGDNKATFN